MQKKVREIVKALKKKSEFICLRVSVREEKQQHLNNKGRAVKEVCVIVRFSPDRFSCKG